MQVLATVGLTVPRHLRACDYETFFRKAGLVEARRPRKPGEKGRQVKSRDLFDVRCRILLRHCGCNADADERQG